MPKKEEVVLEEIKVTDEMLGNIKEFKGRVFKQFMQMDEAEGDMMFAMFVKEGLLSAGVPIEDPYEQLSLTDFTNTLNTIMELNNMDELFRAIERLSRTMPSQ